jgi:hypothetical protein
MGKPGLGSVQDTGGRPDTDLNMPGFVGFGPEKVAFWVALLRVLPIAVHRFRDYENLII